MLVVAQLPVCFKIEATALLPCLRLMWKGEGKTAAPRTQTCSQAVWGGVCGEAPEGVDPTDWLSELG